MAGGRPVKYSSTKKIQKVIDAYFTACEAQREHPTVTGLALAVGLSRQGLIEYQDKERFSDTIKKAKLRIENHLEQRLFSANVTGVIFNLKNNFGWPC